MSLVTVLALLLFPCLVVNWTTFAVFAVAARRTRDIRALLDRRWLSLGIAVANTSLAVLALSYFVRHSWGPEVNALLLTAPVFVLTAINLIALWLTWRRSW